MTRAPTILFLCSSLVYGQAVAVTPPGTNANFSTLVTAARYIRVTISIQDGMAQSLANLNLAGYAVTATESTGQSVQIGGGALWQAAERGGLSLVTPHVAAVAATQARAKSRLEILSVFGAELAYDLALAGAANIPHVNPAKLVGKVWRLTPIVLSHKLVTLNNQRDKVQPDVISTFSADALDPAALYSIPAGFGLSVQKLFLAAPGGPRSITVDLQEP